MSIKIVEAPSVYLVGHQQVNVSELDRFLSDEGVGSFQSDAKVAGEELIEVAGRLCYMSFAHPRPGGNEKYIQNILKVGHGSVCEHEVFSFIIAGVSRSLTHEFVRHRVGFSYSQLSQRYVDESDVAFVIPPEYLDDRERRNFWVDTCEFALARYRELLHISEPKMWTTAEKKRIRESARSVLPNCTETKIFVTGNARALRHFIELRGSEHADAEIRRLAHAVLAVLRKASPHVFGDFESLEVEGDTTLTTAHRKV